MDHSHMKTSAMLHEEDFVILVSYFLLQQNAISGRRREKKNMSSHLISKKHKDSLMRFPIIKKMELHDSRETW